ncbi:hypothetical protein V3851_04585 [Paenibacillus sp. M1]|uniref:Uncharacterized protein n=1 Tax=Paenibacillus haidiansis TaxID=1574488 RepID=A0ABU7VNR1_9BACL
MKSIKIKAFVGISTLVLIFGGVTIFSSELIDVSAATSPYEEFPKEKREMLESIERKKYEARSEIAGKEIELKNKEAELKRTEDLKKSLTNEESEAPITTEILDFIDDPLRNKVIKFTNGWITPTESGAVSVYGGALVNDLEQGVVLVRHYDEKRFMTGSSIIKTPDKLGAIEIKNYKDMVLTLVTEDGTELQFDVRVEKFQQ